MKHLHSFALRIWRASVDRSAYPEFLREPMGRGLGYLFCLVTLLAFFGMLPIAVTLAFLSPQAEHVANEQLEIVKNWYPDELVLTITGGILSTNVEEPYVLDLPNEWSELGDEMPFAHAVVIDTEGSTDDFESYDTAILLTDTSAVLKDDDGGLRVFRYTQAGENIVIDEEFVTDIVGMLDEFTPLLPWFGWSLVLLLLFVLPFLLGGLMWLVELLFLSWASVILLIVSSVTGRDLSYGRLFHIGLYGLTGSLLLNFVLQMMTLSVWWASYLLFFAWMIAVTLSFPATSPVSAPPPAGEGRRQ